MHLEDCHNSMYRTSSAPLSAKSAEGYVRSSPFCFLRNDPLVLSTPFLFSSPLSLLFYRFAHHFFAEGARQGNLHSSCQTFPLAVSAVAASLLSDHTNDHNDAEDEIEVAPNPFEERNKAMEMLGSSFPTLPCINFRSRPCATIQFNWS